MHELWSYQVFVKSRLLRGTCYCRLAICHLLLVRYIGLPQMTNRKWSQ